MVGYVARPKIIETSGLIADNEGYALSLIEGSLCMECGLKSGFAPRKTNRRNEMMATRVPDFLIVTSCFSLERRTK
jgi:hypothetical protein